MQKNAKKIAQKRWCVKIGCACAFFLLFFAFFELLFCIFFLFFWLPFAFFLLFDMHSFWPAAFFLLFLCISFAFPGHPLWVWFCLFFAFLWILEISELGCKVHHNDIAYVSMLVLSAAWPGWSGDPDREESARGHWRSSPEDDGGHHCAGHWVEGAMHKDPTSIERCRARVACRSRADRLGLGL